MNNSINIPLAHPVGSTVYLFRGTQVLADTVKSVIIREFYIDAASPTPTSVARYRLQLYTGEFHESELFSSPDEILLKIATQIKKLKQQ